MKNRLLALMALCAATGSTMPLWAAYPDDPTLEFVDPNFTALQETPGSQQVYYIYHVATGKFMNDGNWKNNWGSELVVNEEGLAVTLSYGQDYELANRDTSDVAYHTNMGYRMSTMEGHTAGNFHELYLLNESGQICVDHNAQGHILWDIVKQDNGYYRIRIASVDPVYGAGTDYANRWIGVDVGDETNNNNIGVNGLIENESGNYVQPEMDWRFVEEDVYALYHAKKNVLKPQIEAAQEAGYTNTTEYIDLYNSETATPEEIEAKAEELRQAVLNYQYSDLQPNTDVTSMMVTNPNFVNADGGATDDGWTSWRENTNNNMQAQAGRDSEFTKGNGATTFDSFFERWTASSPQGDWYVEQELTEIPDGKYRLTANVFTNASGEGLFLYAKTEMGETMVEATHNATDYQVAPYSLEFSVINGSGATIGFRSEGFASNWSAVGYFQLTYLGAAGTTREYLSELVADIQNELTDLIFSNAWRERFEATVATANEAVQNADLTDEEVLAIARTLEAERDSVQADAAAYATLQSYVNPAIEDLSDPTNPYGEALQTSEYARYILTLNQAYESRTFDSREIDSVEVRGQQAYTRSIAKLLTDGTTKDVTGMLENPEFANNNASGWSGTGITGANNGTVEMFNKEFDFYQEFTGMPAGTYEMTLQGFYRPTDNDPCQAAWGVEGDHTNDVLAYAYINDGLSALNHCYDHVTDTVVSGNDITLSVSDETINGKIAVNNLTSASMVLAHGDYPVTVKGYVGSDGVLRVGVKLGSEGRLANCWAAFGHFDVKYLGASDMTGASSTLNELISQAQEVLNREDVTTAEAKTQLNTAITTANSAVQAGLTEESYRTNTDALNAAITAGQEAITAVNALVTKAENHDNKLWGSGEDSYAEYDGTKGFDALADLVEEILLKTEGDDETPGEFESMAQVEQYSADLDRYYVQMVTSDFDGSSASIDSEVDATAFIVNPSFSVETIAEGATTPTETASSDGWTISGSNSYRGTTTSAFNYEMYGGDNDGNALAQDASVSQKLYGLPAGYYRLLWNGYYRFGNATEAAEARLAAIRADEEESINAEAFVSCGVNNWSEPLQSIFNHVHDRKYSGDGIVMPDSLFPDMPNQLYHVVLNNVTGADYAFDLGEYESSLVFHVEEGEEPTIGVRKTASVLRDWTIFDNFRLVYYGDGDANKPEDFETSVGETVAEGTAEVVATRWYTINGVRVDEPKQRGIYIRQDVMGDGSVKATKVLVNGK